MGSLVINENSKVGLGIIGKRTVSLKEGWIWHLTDAASRGGGVEIASLLTLWLAMSVSVLALLLFLISV